MVNSSELLIVAIVAILILWGLRYFWLMLFAPQPKSTQRVVRYDQYGDTRQRGKGNRSLY